MYFEVANILMDFAPKFGLLACASGNIMFMIKELEKRFPGKGNALATALMAGSAEITSAEQGYRLMEMAELVRSDADARRFFAVEPFEPLFWEKELSDNSPFKQSFRAFLSEYGHRGVYEVEIMNPRWREDPFYLLHVVRSTIDTADLVKIKLRQGVAAGRGAGLVSIVHHPDEGRKLAQGDVLVAPSTDPAWTPLFLRASAIVMETGGHLSLGACRPRVRDPSCSEHPRGVTGLKRRAAGYRGRRCREGLPELNYIVALNS